MNPKILFTSPCGPYPKLPVDKDPIDYFYYRNTYKQKVFQLRSFQSWHSLHFLAQNIAVDSVVLENPSFRKFQKEVEHGEYQIVAIGFTILLTQKVLEMAEWLKQKHPDIEIMLGGYGTAIFKESFETADRLKGLADYICFGEGVGYLNTIIHDKWNIQNKNEIKQDLLPSRNSFFRTRIELFKQIILVGGLGCVYGCSFCATSSQFNKKYISMFSGKQLFESLLEQTKKYPNVQSAIIYEEDFLLNKEKVLEFKECYEQSEVYGKPLLLTVFASVKSILKYEIEELIACRIGTIFIGVESLDGELLEKEGLVKRNGEAETLFKKLHAHGINTLGSLIIGWDNQTIDIVKADLHRFVAMNPTFYQVVPLHGVPGTKLWEDMKKENRISPDYQVEHDGINNFNFELKHFSQTQAQEIISETYSGLVSEGGPWPFRLFENVLEGYNNLNNSENPVLSTRAFIYKQMIFPVCILAFASRFFFWGRNYRTRWNKSMALFAKGFPLWFGISVVISPLVIVYLSVIYLFAILFYTINPKGDQPDFIRKEYSA